MTDEINKPQQMRVIWKFPLELVDIQTVRLRRDAIFRLLAEQDGVLTLWYELDPEAEQEERQIVIIGTGHEVPVGLIHLGSVVQGIYVWHVYSVPSMSDLFMRLGGLL